MERALGFRSRRRARGDNAIGSTDYEFRRMVAINLALLPDELTGGVPDDENVGNGKASRHPVRL